MSRPKYETLHIYGDMLLPSCDGQGWDVSTQRMDELDKTTLAFVQEAIKDKPDFHVIDLGGGSGRHSLRMAQMGARATMVDVNDVSKSFDDAVTANIVPEGALQMVAKNFADLNVSQDLQPYDMIYSQRALNYLPYLVFERVMRDLVSNLPKGGKVFMSLAGWETEYGQSFPLRDAPLEERYGKLTEEMQKKHAIYNPLTPYKAEEVGALFEGLGLEIESLTTSTFGNVKVIADKLV